MLCAHVLTSQQSYIRPLFDRRILWYGVRCPSVRPSVRTYVASSTILVGRIYQELCGLGCSNLVCTLYMERRSLYIFKVKGQISRSLGLYREFWHLDPCGQDKARTMQSRLLTLSMCTSYGKRKEPIDFSRSKVKFQGHWPCIKTLAFGSVWVGYRKNYAVSVVNLSTCISYGSV